MTQINWSKALTYETNLINLAEDFGEERISALIGKLVETSATFAISQGRLFTSDFGTHVVKQLLADWILEIEPKKHFEILTVNSGGLALNQRFNTYDEAVKALTDDPLISANQHHPYFWGKLFEIVLCGGDGCLVSE